jgi:PKD repeat protein
VTYVDVEPNGLAVMVGGLIEANLAQHPRRAGLLRRAVVDLVAIDADVAVSLGIERRGVRVANGTADGQFSDPWGVAVGGDRRVYVADTDAHRIQVFEPLLGPAILPVPPSTDPPTDTDGDGLYDDVNGNGRLDFADVVLYFNAMDWIVAHEPVGPFDYNGNDRIDFADVVWVFNAI